jgi:putative phosphoribosyl transferase
MRDFHDATRCAAQDDRDVATASGTSQAPRFADRSDAGLRLAQHLGGYRAREPVVVAIGLGAAPVAAAVARALEAPLDAVAVAPLTLGRRARKRFGTAAEGAVTLFDRQHLTAVEAQPEAADTAIIDTQRRLEQQTHTWHAARGRVSLSGREVLLVADTIADEELAAAAACEVRDRGAQHVTLAVPFARLTTAATLVDWVDELICLASARQTPSTASLYADDRLPSDFEGAELLAENRDEQNSRISPPHI